MPRPSPPWSRRVRGPLVGLLIVALGTPAWAADAEEAPPAVAESPTPAAPAPLAAPCDPRDPCCGPGEGPCMGANAARLLLAGGGIVAFGGSMLALTLGGDSLAAGDPLPQLMGLGFVAVLGAGTGGLIGLVTGQKERQVDDPAATPTFAVNLSPGGSSVTGETAPWGLGIGLSPRFHFGDVVHLEPQVALSFDLGNYEEVDPRPQLAPPGSGFPLALRDRVLDFGGGVQWAISLPCPRRAQGAPERAGPLELRFRHGLAVRQRTLFPGEAAAQVLETVTVLPVLAGFRWHLSPRQALTVWAGPRLDRVGFSDPGATVIRKGSPYMAALYGEAWYHIDVPLTPRELAGTHVAGRLTLGYIHSRDRGISMEGGASIGFFGPLHVAWDFRFRRRGQPIAWQVGAGLWLGKNSGMFVRIGVAAPDVQVGAR